jgi:23S rRNA (cytidine1920-2'-O)/16S rRNA (cytidine1409-2'-O)-methyltransferase
VGKGGVVRDAAAHTDAIRAVIAAAAALSWQPAGLVGSPITGPAGNHEYLLWLRESEQNPGPHRLNDPAQIAAVVEKTLAANSSTPLPKHGLEPNS